MSLSKFEQETIVNFNQGEDTAHIFTYNKAWQRHLEKRLGLKPARVNSFGGKDYELPRRFIRAPLAPRQLSAEEKVRLGQRLRKSATAQARNSIQSQPRVRARAAEGL
jgi:hypothetical protein